MSALSVVGIGTVRNEVRPHREMLYRAVRDALDEAGLERTDLDVGVTAASDLAEGRGLANQFNLDATGGVMRPFDLRLSADSLSALGALAAHMISSEARNGLVAGVLRSSDMEGGGTFGQLILSRLDPVYEQPMVAPFVGATHGLLSEFLEREATGAPPGPPPPAVDVAAAVVLRRGVESGAVLVRHIGWHSCPGWTLDAYRRSLRAAAAHAWARLGGKPDLVRVDAPAYPSCLVDVAREELDVNTKAAFTSASSDGNLLMDGLARFAEVARYLKRRPAGDMAVVQSWQGPGSSGVALAVLERAE